MGDDPQTSGPQTPGDPPLPPFDPADPGFDPSLAPHGMPDLGPLGVYWWLLASFGWLLFPLQIFCIVHVVRTGRPYWWIWIILAGSFIGVAAYLIVEVRPSFGKLDWQALWWRLKSSAQRIAHRREQLEYAPTVKNRFLLAEELHNAGQLDEECEVLAGGLQGAFKDDAETLLRLSQAHLEAGRVDEAAKIYARITPDRSSEFQGRYKLQQARLLGAKGENIKAETMFQDLLKQRRSEAPRYYLAEFLIATRRGPEGTKILRDILYQYRHGTRVWRHQESQWYFAAKRALRAAGKGGGMGRETRGEGRESGEEGWKR